MRRLADPLVKAPSKSPRLWWLSVYPLYSIAGGSRVAAGGNLIIPPRRGINLKARLVADNGGFRERLWATVV